MTARHASGHKHLGIVSDCAAAPLCLSLGLLAAISLPDRSERGAQVTPTANEPFGAGESQWLTGTPADKRYRNAYGLEAT